METMTEKYNYNITKLPPLDDGKGSISVTDRLSNPEDPLTSEHLTVAETEIYDPANMIDVNTDSDGCPDGRSCGKYINNLMGGVARPKVFGGGQTMAMAGIVGAGLSNEGSNLKDTFAQGLSLLSAKQVNFGAHTSDHKSEGQSGCGAIDNAYVIWQTALEPDEQQKITNTISALDGDKGTELAPVINEVFDNARSAFGGFNEEGYSGQKVTDGAVKRGKVVAELNGTHNEVVVVINTDIDDKTFDQSKIRQKTDDVAQAFSVDVPRMRQLAEKLFDTPAERQKAFISMFVYSLATSTVLTKNDMPLYLISRTDNPSIDFSFN